MARTRTSINEEPFGDGSLQVTASSAGRTHALFTCRYKDRDVTADELEAIAESCMRVAKFLRGDV